MQRLRTEFSRELNVILRSRWIHRPKRLLHPLLFDMALFLKLQFIFNRIPIFFLDEDLAYHLLLARLDIETVHLQIDLVL